MIFSKGRIANNSKFLIKGEEIEIVKNYKYLGVIFSRSGSFFATRKYLKEQVMKAMYSLINKCRSNHLSVKCQLEMFDKAIVPILLYGSEIWGFENIDILERVQLYFCKHILRLKQSTPNFMIYGELGRYPLSIKSKLRMVNFWIQLNSNDNMISSILCKLLNINFYNYGFRNNWLCFVKSIFDNCGMSNVWENTNLFPKNWIVASIEQKLKDQYLQEWLNEINTSSNGLCYRIFKTDLEFENYLSLLSQNFLFTFCKFRCGNHRLPVETGRWHNTPRTDRLCILCDSSDTGDEFHYIFSCDYFKKERKQYLSSFYCNNVNTLKFEQLFGSKNIVELEKLCKFIRFICLKVSPPG